MAQRSRLGEKSPRKEKHITREHGRPANSSTGKNEKEERHETCVKKDTGRKKRKKQTADLKRHRQEEKYHTYKQGFVIRNLVCTLIYVRTYLVMPIVTVNN